jgi:hypothetical protein
MTIAFILLVALGGFTVGSVFDSKVKPAKTWALALLTLAMLVFIYVGSRWPA